jgi:hypothetical protein
MSDPRIAACRARVQQYEAAIATFARLHEELTDLRDNAIVPEVRERIEAMLRLNAETVLVLKDSLTSAVVALKHTEQMVAAAAGALQPYSRSARH